MTEDLTSEILAYLFNELDPPRRAQLEARLTRDPEAAGLFKSIADGLAGDALGQSPAAALSAAEQKLMEAAILRTASEALVPEASARKVIPFGRYFWPAAAAVLLALNVSQWLAHSRTRALPPERTDHELTEAPSANGSVDIEPAMLRKPGVAPASGSTTTLLSFSQTITVALTAPGTQHPYAWSAFDGVRHQGVLELHNLPAVPADHSLELWILGVGAKSFERVGEIPPQFYGRSGNITYKLRSATVTPAQILITLERNVPLPRGSVRPGYPARAINLVRFSIRRLF